MICTTTRKGVDCPFMKPKGCSYTGETCHEIIEQCDGCKRTAEFPSGWFCTATPEPSMKWRKGNCNLATHVTTESSKTKVKINPLKASKRASKKS